MATTARGLPPQITGLRAQNPELAEALQSLLSLIPKDPTGMRGQYGLGIDFSLPNNAITTVTFQQRREQFGLSLQPDGSVLVPKGGAGVYIVRAGLAFAPNAAGRRILAIATLSGSTGGTVNTFAQQAVVGSALANQNVTISGPVTLNEFDRFIVWGFQDTGGALNIPASANNGLHLVRVAF